MKEIPLTKGKVAIVDDEDFDWLMKWVWFENHGYAGRKDLGSRNTNRRMIAMHREIMQTPDGMEVDHINGNGLDNRKSNLRNCTYSQNAANSKLNSRNTSGYRGVYRRNDRIKKWAASVKINQKTITLGYFETPEEAARAYDAKAQELYGEFATTNF